MNSFLDRSMRFYFSLFHFFEAIDRRAGDSEAKGFPCGFRRVVRSPSRALLLSSFVCIATSGCSSLLLDSTGRVALDSPASGITPPTPASAATHRDTNNSSNHLDVFVARGFLGGADYERYVLKDSVLWRECGAVTIGRVKSEGPLDGDDLLHRDPNLDLQERRVEILTAEQREELTSSLRFLSQALTSEGASLPKPGSVQSLSGPGVFELNFLLDGREHRIVTSVDGVANGENSRLRALRKLFQVIRDQGPVICKSRSFYGM